VHARFNIFLGWCMFVLYRIIIQEREAINLILLLKEEFPFKGFCFSVLPETKQ
jgi:hypothetical protein